MLAYFNQVAQLGKPEQDISAVKDVQPSQEAPLRTRSWSQDGASAAVRSAVFRRGNGHRKMENGSHDQTIDGSRKYLKPDMNLNQMVRNGSNRFSSTLYNRQTQSKVTEKSASEQAETLGRTEAHNHRRRTEARETRRGSHGHCCSMISMLDLKSHNCFPDRGTHFYLFVDGC